MRKEELRRDPVREYIVRGVEYIKDNQSTVIKIFAGLVILVAGFSYYNHVEKVDFKSASNIAGLAQNSFINGDIDGSMVKFERVLEDYPNTSGAVQALVYLLNDALKQENYEEITNFISKYNGDFSIIDDRIVQASLFKILGDMALIDGNTDDALTEAKSKGGALGVFTPDVGATYHLEGIHNLSPKISVVVQNIGGMDFGGAGTIPMVINTGFATESEFGPFDFITAVDYHDLMNGQKLASDNNMFTERNLKIGFEVGWWRLANSHHLASFRLGRNGPYNSKGLSLNLWKFKLDLVSYSQETGGYAGEKEDKRWAFAMGLIF